LLILWNIRNIVQQFRIFFGHSEYFMENRYIFYCFGILYQDKSGNSAPTWEGSTPPSPSYEIVNIEDKQKIHFYF
jgi:hypothetical protein